MSGEESERQLGNRGIPKTPNHTYVTDAVDQNRTWSKPPCRAPPQLNLID